MRNTHLGLLFNTRGSWNVRLKDDGLLSGFKVHYTSRPRWVKVHDTSRPQGVISVLAVIHRDLSGLKFTIHHDLSGSKFTIHHDLSGLKFTIHCDLSGSYRSRRCFLPQTSVPPTVKSLPGPLRSFPVRCPVFWGCEDRLPPGDSPPGPWRCGDRLLPGDSPPGPWHSLGPDKERWCSSGWSR